MLTHQANPSYPGLGHGTLAHFRGFLTEEKIKLVIILLSAVWDEVCMDECGICRNGRKMERALLALQHMLLYTQAAFTLNVGSLRAKSCSESQFIKSARGSPESAIGNIWTIISSNVSVTTLKKWSYPSNLVKISLYTVYDEACEWSWDWEIQCRSFIIRITALK